MLASAIALAAEVHAKQYDKGGDPYILHCLEVMRKVRERGYQEEVQCAAVLHDVIEDVDESWDDLHPMPVEKEILHVSSQTVLTLVECLTKEGGEDYLGSYIPSLMSDGMFFEELSAIKIADLEHNLDPTRQPTLRDKDLLRLQKYHMAYRMLRGEQ